jgi:hypothetical protein
MTDQDMSAGNRRSKVGWFAGGALAVAAAIGLFLYVDGYFSPANSGVEAEMPDVFIEAD